MTAGSPVRPADRWGLLAAWLLGCAFLLFMTASAITHFTLSDPDDQLRLQEVRDLLAGQSWFDVGQYRINPPTGVAMHWSRLVDVPLALVMLLMRPLFGTAAAETAALVAVPLITYGGTLLLVAALARRLAGRGAALLAALLLALDVGVFAQMRPMRIDHHGWQILLSLAIVLGIAGRTRARPAALAGVAAALLLDISIEGLPFVVAAAALLALHGLVAPAARRWQLPAFLAGLAGGSLAATLATHGTLRLAPHCDAVSPVHVAVFVVAALGSAAAAALAPRAPWQRLLLLALVAAGCGAVYAGGAPACLAGPFAQLDPLVRDTWYLRVREGLPIWQQTATVAWTAIGYPLLGLVGALVGWRQAPPAGRTGWSDYGALLLVATLIGMLVQRASGLANILALPGAMLLMLWLLGHAGTLRAMPLRVIASAAAVLALLPIVPAMLATGAFAGDRPPAPTPAPCDSRAALAPLTRLPAARFLTLIDLGSALVVHSRHSVLATPHHRNVVGMRDTILAFTADDATARAIVARHAIGYVAICPNWPELAVYATMAPRGLAATLAAGHAPAWLTPLPHVGAAPWLWKVRE